MTRIETEIEAPPETVRAVMLDFARYKEWHTSVIEKLECIPASKDGISLVEGDRIDTRFPNTPMVATVLRNSPAEFRWYGSVMGGAFAGEHYFSFNPSVTRPGCTTFVHGEDNTGWLRFLFNPGWPLHKVQSDMFEAYSNDLKARVEATER
ncbi:hypothetical protein EJ04DRAFT_555030 [Polyplosphaeria fusca]|uniref:Polyketide cyclase n=1 Tax=Polyplosphaeria fusca TaxID=682080 RepID=A0A9P4QSS2_9PLEO|nr:hypothetical protein EJ04DRAFT_555030 [Polyplosphaeria fusca]